jgi:hypothetical protein
MDARKLVLPAAVFVGGALLGRLIGLRGLVRAGMAALTVANMSETAGLLTSAGKSTNRKTPTKAAPRRSATKKSAPTRTTKRANAVSANTRTH